MSQGNRNAVEHQFCPLQQPPSGFLGASFPDPNYIHLSTNPTPCSLVGSQVCGEKCQYKQGRSVG